MTTGCARCGAGIDPKDAYYSSDGLVCTTCHLADQEADEAQMRAAEEEARHGFGGLGLGGPAISFTQRRVETRHADGGVTVEESEALDGWATRFFRALLGK